MAKNAENYIIKDTLYNFSRNNPEYSWRHYIAKVSSTYKSSKFSKSPGKKSWDNLKVKNTEENISKNNTGKFTEPGLKQEYILSSLRWPPPKLGKNGT